MLAQTSCVLCRTCANFVGRPFSERRGHYRVCGAGLVLGPTTYECESYVQQSAQEWARKTMAPREDPPH
jgi:hypothetical protein